MNAVIISDLHIGSRYFLNSEFDRFLKEIPENCELILNGDILDNPQKRLTLPHQHAMESIKRTSHRRKVVWLYGNHDYGFSSNGFGKVEFRKHYSLDNRILIAHGHEFDDIMPKSRIFITVFHLMHELRSMLGARPEHVAHYAKKWKFLYRILRANVMKNAVRYALESGYEAVTCGHTHYPEDQLLNGVRYINTGAWTESCAHCLFVTDDALTLGKAGDVFAVHRKKRLPSKQLLAANG